ILQLLVDAGVPPTPSPGGSGAASSTPTLLGDHDEHAGEARDRAAIDDELFGDAVRRIVAKWPPPPFPLRGRDAGGNLAESWGAVLDPPTHDVRQAFAAVLRRSLGPRPGGLRKRTRIDMPTVAGLGVLP